MAINIIFNPVFALLLFMTGIWMGSMIHPLYGLLSIIGGLLLGSYNFFKNDKAMNKKQTKYFYASLIFLFSIMSLAYLAISAFLL